MRYVKNLITKEHSVNLSNYHPISEQTSYSIQNRGLAIFAIISLILAFSFIGSRFIIGLILLIVSAIIYPKSSKWLEKSLIFTFTTRIKSYLLGFLFLLSIPSNLQYSENEKTVLAAEFALQKIQNEQYIELQRKRETENKILLDKGTRFKELGDTEFNKHNYKKALTNYGEYIKILPEVKEVNYKRGLCYENLSCYDSAIICFAQFPFNNALEIGRCYEKKGDKIEALKAYKAASTDEGEKQYNRLNPIKRRLLYYQTVCCDGTDSPSNAKGRGACSHHGGVCNWNKPIYEEYREYQNYE